MVFPTFFYLSLYSATRSSWSEPQSTPGLVFADCIEFLHLWLQRMKSIWFWYWPSGDVHVSCRVFFCVVRRGCLLWPVRSLGKTVSLCPASFRTPRPNLPLTPGVSSLPTFAVHASSPCLQLKQMFWHWHTYFHGDTQKCCSENERHYDIKQSERGRREEYFMVVKQRCGNLDLDTADSRVRGVDRRLCYSTHR